VVKRIIFSIFFVFLSGCVVQPTSEGKAVRVVDKKTEYKCTFVDMVTGSGSAGWTPAHDAEGAMADVRNKAAKVGANAIRVLNIDSNMATTVVVAEALNCEFK